MAYLGPGDIVGSAGGFWGLRGYNGAYCTGSNPCCDIVDGSGLNTTTINITTSGLVDTAAITTFVGLHGTAHVTKLYDQTVAANNMVQVTVSLMPTINLSPSGLLSGKAAMSFTSAGSQNISTQSPIPTHGQPITILLFQLRTATGQATAGIGTTVSIGMLGAGNAVMFAGTLQTIGSTPDLNVWHSFGGLFNGASSTFSIDGANPALGGTVGANSANSTDGFNSTNATLDGMICEIGYWPSGWSPTQLLAWSNQSTGNPNDGSTTFWFQAAANGGIPPPGSQLNVFYA